MYGGPFTHEVDAIRDERNRAAVMGKKPNFDRIFEGVELSDGAKEVIADIQRPIEEQVFVPHDYSHEPVSNVKHLEEVDKGDKKEAAPKGTGEKEPPAGDKSEKKNATQQDSKTVGSLENILEGLDKK